MDESQFTELDIQIIYYIDKNGPVFFAKLAKRLDKDVEEVRARLKVLKKAGYLERVTSTMVDYRLKKANRVSKHRNHTYFGLTRKARHYLRNNDIELDINLRPPWLQA